MRNKLLLCLFLFFTTSILSAQQYAVSGNITNQDNHPLEFVNATLLKNDTIAIQKTTADSLGKFSMIAEQGDYTLRLEQFGTQILKREISLFETTNLGNITVEESILLEGVTINAQKKLVEQKMDRLVYNVENSIASQGMNGLDAIRNTPLVRVQEENISIVGKGGVSVMINDRIVNLSGSELANYLQSLRSDDIARIEVITTPPSKYDAQGNSGIINIILKRNPNRGWSGNVSGTYQRNSYNGYRTAATLNYQSKKWSSSLKIRKYDLAYQLDGTRNLIGTQNSIYTTETRKDQASAFGLNYSLDYKINDLSNAGFIYDFNQGNYDINAKGSSRYEQLTQVDSTLNTRAVQHWETPTHTFNAYYDVKLDTLGKKLNFTGNYLSNAPDKNNDFNTNNTTTNNQATVRNNSNMLYNIYSGQADLTLPYKLFTLETGAKYTFLDNTANVGYYNSNGSDYILDSQNSNLFEYKEHNYAGYISLQKEFNEKWSAKAGLRYEYTALQGQTPGDENSNLKKEYGKLFPTAYVSYKPDEDHVFSLNYSRRINRPDFQSLNPFRWYTNPYMYYSGTPTLQPSYNNNVELSYSYKGKLTFGLYNQNSRNNTSSIARLEDGIYSNVIENAYDQNRIGMNLGYYDTLFKIWETSVSANASYTRTSPSIPELQSIKVYSLFYTINNTITLNSDKTYFMLFNFMHALPFTYANIKIQDQLDFSAGIRGSFLDKKLQVSAVFSDIFKTLKNDGYSYSGGFKSEFNQYNDHRRLTVSATYTFGNNKVKGATKNINFEERNRAN